MPLLLVVTLTAAGAAAAAGYGLTAPKRYRATAQLLVSPVAASDATFTGLPLLRDSGGKRTAAASAAAMLASPQVADAVRSQLGLSRSRDAVLAALHARVVDASDVVAVTAEDTSASGAAQLANAFADTLVSQRTASFQSQLATTINSDTKQLDSLPESSRAALQQRLATLRGLEGQSDPTLKVTAQAAAPAAAYWPRLRRLIAIGAGLGFAAGLVVALLLLLGRGRSTAAAAAYDRSVSERFVKRLEQRADERIEALLAEQERLTAREAALAVREGELAVRLDERATAAVDERVEELAARRADLAEQERALAAREARLAEREQALAEMPAPAAPPGPEVEQRERELEERVAALGHREAELARRAAAVAARQREAAEQAEALERRTEELEEWAAELAARAERRPEPEPAPPLEAVPEPLPEPVPAPAAAAEPSAQPVSTADGRWNLFSLQRLVDERGGEHPERIEEWSSYLYFLREYAKPDGTVPASFDWLIEDTFADLVA